MSIKWANEKCLESFNIGETVEEILVYLYSLSKIYKFIFVKDL